MGSAAISLNFRRGDVFANARALTEKGHAMETGPKPYKDGGGSATLRDPDGYLIFLDSAPGETKPD